MKNTYIAVTIKENEKFYSYVLKVNSDQNLLYRLKIKNIECAWICESKKHCEETVKRWNEGYKSNKENLY